MTLVCFICLVLSDVFSSPKYSCHNSTKLKSMKYMQMKASFHGHTHWIVEQNLVPAVLRSINFSASKACFRSKTFWYWRENEMETESERDMHDAWCVIVYRRFSHMRVNIVYMKTYSLLLKMGLFFCMSMSNWSMYLSTGLCTGQIGEIRLKLRSLGWTEWTDKFWCLSTSSGPMESLWVS